MNFATEPHTGLHCIFKLHEGSWVPTLIKVVFPYCLSSYLMPFLCLMLGFQSLVIIFLSFGKPCVGDLRGRGTGCLSCTSTIAERDWMAKRRQHCGIKSCWQCQLSLCWVEYQRLGKSLSLIVLLFSHYCMGSWNRAISSGPCQCSGSVIHRFLKSRSYSFGVQ